MLKVKLYLKLYPLMDNGKKIEKLNLMIISDKQPIHSNGQENLFFGA